MKIKTKSGELPKTHVTLFERRNRKMQELEGTMYHYEDGKRYLKPVYDYEEVQSFSTPIDMPPFWIEMAGISRCDGNYRIERNNSKAIVCEYILQGTGTLRINGRTYHPSAGDVYILPEFSDHEYFSDSKEPWVKVFFNLQGTGVTKILKAFGFKERILFHNCEDLQPLFEEFFNKTKEPLQVEEIMEECSVIYLRLLMRLYNKTKDITQESLEMEILKDFIESNIGRELTIAEMSAAIYRSKDYTNKLVKHYYHTSLYAYYINLRIEKAKALLQHTSLTITEIAEKLGYQNSQYFAKQFRHLTGVTPTYYRNTGCVKEDD